MDPIAHTFGSNCVVHGTAIPHPLAPILEDAEAEYAMRRETVMQALEALTEELKE